jgi:hypothetical protein
MDEPRKPITMDEVEKRMVERPMPKAHDTDTTGGAATPAPLSAPDLYKRPCPKCGTPSWQKIGPCLACRVERLETEHMQIWRLLWALNDKGVLPDDFDGLTWLCPNCERVELSIYRECWACGEHRPDEMTITFNGDSSSVSMRFPAGGSYDEPGHPEPVVEPEDKPSPVKAAAGIGVNASVKLTVSDPDGNVKHVAYSDDSLADRTQDVSDGMVNDVYRELVKAIITLTKKEYLFTHGHIVNAMAGLENTGLVKYADK